ncbi:hydroxymethylbilane synthase [Candidatus Rhodobacter oscarellae]|nr:hydroxymethylbilane synthase [Candidatus Rhodobacter lobularis]
MADWFEQNAVLRIGTRGSPLALAQAHEVRDRLMAAHDLPAERFAVTVLKTTGDAVQDRPLSEIGGKGLFTKELDLALEAGEIDIAVHSMKDVPTVLVEGMAITAVLPREDVRDVLVSDHAASIEALPQGAVFGTSSLRRRAQLLHRRPDLQMVEFRGNVQTRLKKLADGVAVATILARAGLNRLGQTELGQTIPETTLLPAVAQGAVGIQQRHDDALAEALAPIHDAPTATRITTERAFLRALDGSCRTPIAALATLADGEIAFRGEVLRPDGSQVLCAARSGTDAAAMGTDAAQELLAGGAGGFY